MHGTLPPVRRLRASFPRTAILAAALLLGSTGTTGRAFAAPAAGHVLVPLKDGTMLDWTVESTDAKGAKGKTAAGEAKEVSWEDMTPLGVLRTHAALAPAADGKARLNLAELAVELGLYAEARAEFEKAEALGALDAATASKAIADAEGRAIEAGVAKAEKLADGGDVAGAREVARNLKLDFAAALDAKKVDEFLQALEAQIAAREAEQLAAQRDLDKMLLELDRVKEIARRRNEAKKQKDLGDRNAQDAEDLMPKGVVTRVRKSADAADAGFVASRRELGRLRRIVPKEGKERDEVLANLAALDKAEFKLLFDAAKFFWREKVYHEAESFAARASYIDPVDPDLLELRNEVREARIHYRVSDVSNAHPTVK